MNTKLSFASLAIATLFCSSSSFAAGFDCNKASGYVEQTICSTPALSSLDDKVSALYSKAMKENPTNAAAIKKSQLSWLKEVRNKSTSYMELQSAYVNRVNDLYAIIGTDKQPSTPATQTAPVATQPAPQTAPVAQSPATPAAENKETVERSCQVQITYSPDAKDQYVTNQKTQPKRLRVTDKGDSFVIHFDHYYGLGDMDSEFISPRGKEFMNVKQENDGTTSFYRKNEANGFIGYIFTSVKGSMKPRFDANLYDCRTGISNTPNEQKTTQAVNTAEPAAQSEAKTYHLKAESPVLNPIELDFSSTSTLDMSVYNDAKNYAQDSNERYRILSIYKEYGVSTSDFDNIVRPQCSAQTDSLMKESKDMQSQWGTFSTDPATRERQQKERYEYLQDWSARYKAATDKMQQCWSDAALRVPHHAPR